MSTILFPSQIRSVNRTRSWCFVHFNTEHAKTWDLDKATKLAIMSGAFVIAVSVAVQFAVFAHAQEIHPTPPTSDLEWEMKYVQKELDQLRGLPLQFALLQVALETQTKQEERWHSDELAWRSMITNGIVGVIGAIALGILGLILKPLGITFGKKETP